MAKNKIRKIAYISGTRADYGLMRDVLKKIQENPKLKLEICATGMHIMKGFGYSLDEIRRDGFKVHKIKSTFKKDNKESATLFIGEFINKLTKRIMKIKPDILIIIGDRIEMLGAAIVGSYLQIPVVHLHGGEVSLTIDEMARHAITKLSHIHLPATKKSAQRIIKMGEEPWRVHVVGAPGVEYIQNEKFLSKEEIESKFEVNLDKPLIIILQHPVSSEIEDAKKQIEITINAVKEIGYSTVIIYPNADAGGRSMIQIIKRYKKNPLFRIFKNINHREFISLLKYSSILVGNSSSGIIESAILKIPVVNVGTRQFGRERSGNIIDCTHNEEDIVRSIKIGLSKKFRKKINNWKSPYFQKNTTKKIIKVLSEIKINKRLIQKQLTY